MIQRDTSVPWIRLIQSPFIPVLFWHTKLFMTLPDGRISLNFCGFRGTIKGIKSIDDTVYTWTCSWWRSEAITFLFLYSCAEIFAEGREKTEMHFFIIPHRRRRYDSFADAVALLSKKAIPSYSTAEDEDKKKAPVDQPQPPPSPYGPSPLDSPRRRRRAVFQLFISIIYCSLPKDC